MTGLRYIGGGSWIPGVPARDLSADEAEQYSVLIEATEAAGHMLYVTATGFTLTDKMDGFSASTTEAGTETATAANADVTLTASDDAPIDQ